ncbi:hypothetical protein CP985_03365 [Malaciobacter mytili LMG 24559]|uniref:Beta-lactamase n=1 Tax=Malaciobacter mytili LMG 24559 TaxID=1032238 RepID=A0AAX2AHY6_9BACT|nr:hypothetical protein [Malaciobacter mytili]AXH16397.1 hypothetical protein AMYT_a0098 [Malaciobacter mytili LMG 24559]RXK16463.1 hypothetical protein CP985_03365 [Malaciobacter mytili LMG 24559]
MLKIILGLTFFILSLNADVSDPLLSNYLKLGGKVSIETKEILKKDEHYKKALEDILTIKKYPSKYKDVHSGELKNTTFNAPNWAGSYINFRNSALEYKNPISAYYGLYIINSFIGLNLKLQDYILFADILYQKEKNMCNSYLNYAAIFEKGLGSSKDFKKALSIYEEGLKNACQKGWQRQIVESKIWYLKRNIE